MAFALQNSTIEEQRCVIRFLTAEGEKPAAIHRRVVTVYGEKCVSDKSVRKWSARFRAGRESVGDDPRPGQANIVITSDLIDKVDDLVRSDRRVTLRMLAVKVDVSYGTVWTIVHDRLRYRKVCAAWVPKQLTDQQKELRMGLALQHLFRYQEDPAFMERIVTGDETWCHHYEPETKRDSMQWKHASSPPPKKFKPCRQQARCCSPSFSTFKVRYLWNSWSTEKPLTPMCTVRHFDAYAGPSRTKDRGCSRRVWFCSMITRVHTSPESHTWNWPSSSGRRWTIRPTVRTCRPAISMCLVH